ncbi:ABC transporter ATP-binding protein [Streptomyces sp. NBC_00820]|uniref:ABC transporter ATP-binding protein n=1 Tax=Streptomyces sp. NBC_00820 TaxID=2975842 RepID=UPI002ED2991F|nr:ABC transporter ATP-binding protein [Streptomyces sp. NBC_00820]
MNAISTRGLRRTFVRKSAEKVALHGIDIEVPEGEVHGLLGPNGAGKSTLCKILSTVLLPTSGTASVMGRDVATATTAVRSLIGVSLGGDRGLYGRLSARQNLRYWGALYGLSGRVLDARVTTLLERVGLSGHADDRAETFSRGMKQRLHLARAIVHDPPVLLLDEPTAGLDPVAAHGFRTIIEELRRERRTVLLATHDMDEAEALCARVTLIDGGRVLATDSPRTLSERAAGHQRVEAVDAPTAVLAELRRLPGVRGIEHHPDAVARIAVDDDRSAREVLRRLVDADVTRVAVVRPNLAEMYLDLVGGRGMEVGG